MVSDGNGENVFILDCPNIVSPLEEEEQRLLDSSFDKSKVTLGNLKGCYCAVKQFVINTCYAFISCLDLTDMYLQTVSHLCLSQGSTPSMKNQIISNKNVRTCREPIVGNDSIAFYEGSCDPFVLVGNRLDLIFRMLDSIYKILKCNELLSICLSHNTEFSPTYSYRIRETFDSVRHVDCLSQSPVQVARQHEMAICNLFI